MKVDGKTRKKALREANQRRRDAADRTGTGGGLPQPSHPNPHPDSTTLRPRPTLPETNTLHTDRITTMKRANEHPQIHNREQGRATDTQTRRQASRQQPHTYIVRYGTISDNFHSNMETQTGDTNRKSIDQTPPAEKRDTTSTGPEQPGTRYDGARRHNLHR
ncbi:Hypothetical predicted protein [Pelobates cultripes]|uniref:Uncharacterized protein n=1 Tax=Pelobates cultripes TaxID=61616 RepID=A0AAD1R3Q6_PELCU|nr:Hypothetical predicted protein [Pelobates cultripes]